MRVQTHLVTDGHWPDSVAGLLHGQPEWFGIEASVRGYFDAARTLSNIAAVAGDDVVGVFLLPRLRSPRWLPPEPA
jgi:hypothetical protein